MPAVEQHALTQRCALIANTFLVHLGLQIKRVGAERAGCIGKTRGPNFQRASIVARVGGRLQVREPILLENRGIGRIRRRQDRCWSWQRPASPIRQKPLGRIGTAWSTSAPQEGSPQKPRPASPNNAAIPTKRERLMNAPEKEKSASTIRPQRAPKSFLLNSRASISIRVPHSFPRSFAGGWGF